MIPSNGVNGFFFHLIDGVVKFFGVAESHDIWGIVVKLNATQCMKPTKIIGLRV